MTGRPRYLFTTLAIVAAAVVWVIADRPEPPRPARAAPPPVAATARPRPALPPTARDLLASAALALTSGQRGRLETLAVVWERETTSLEAEVTAASAEFERFMTEAQRAGRTSLDEIRRRSLEMQDMSAALRGRRVRHGEEAAGVLTGPQRATLAEVNRIPGGDR